MRFLRFTLDLREPGRVPELTDGLRQIAGTADVRPDSRLHFPGRFAFVEGRAPAADG